MKIFVSGQINDIENVHSVQAALRDAGHKITHDWTKNEAGDKMLAGDAAKLADINETGKRATLDIQGVVDCEIYVACTTNERAGKGMYAELGAALALNVTTKSPKIYIVGPLNHMSVFYFHPAVKRLATTKELLGELDQKI